RIARAQGKKLDAAALNRRTRPEPSVRVKIAFRESIVRRIGVDQDPRRAALLRIADLEPPEKHPVPREHDLAFDIDPQLLGSRGVFRPDVIGVQHLTGSEARNSVAVECSKGGATRGVLVAGNRLLVERKTLLNRSDDA